MHHVTIFIDDQRYTAPTLLLFTVADLAEAEVIARQKLEETPEHRHIQVFHEEELIYAFSRVYGVKDAAAAKVDDPLL